MKRLILVLVVIAVAAVVAAKFLRKETSPPQSQTVTTAAPSSANTQSKRALYLFHDTSDQDEGCRRIYAFVDRAERELAGRVEVRRPDIKSEKKTLEQFQVRVLPTILIVSPSGAVEERFEGEGEQVASRIEQTLERLKASAQ